MDKKTLIEMAIDFTAISEHNYIKEEIAISNDVVGIKMFDPPVFAFGSAKDPYFSMFKNTSIIGEHFLLPEDWLQGSNTVISFFLPFTEAVREGNAEDMYWPSEEWLHGRIEGQSFVNKMTQHLMKEIINSGYNAVVPASDERFWTVHYDQETKAQFTSNWSERHAAFVCGLGTFGLSKGLITKQGVAGRFGSIISDLNFTPTKREYTEIYEYCSMCGECVTNCPVDAITIQHGKDHAVCSRFLEETKSRFNPRYGCGKCQVAVSCEYKIPEILKTNL